VPFPNISQPKTELLGWPLVKEFVCYDSKNYACEYDLNNVREWLSCVHDQECETDQELQRPPQFEDEGIDSWRVVKNIPGDISTRQASSQVVIAGQFASQVVIAGQFAACYENIQFRRGHMFVFGILHHLGISSISRLYRHCRMANEVYSKFTGVVEGVGNSQLTLETNHAFLKLFRQLGGTDCGVFMLCFINKLTSDSSLEGITSAAMENARKKIASQLLEMRI